MSDNKAVAIESLQIEHASTVDRVAAELRRACFDGELSPGTPLREIAIADSLGVGRSTVREALAALVAEGLAVRIPNRGTQVRRPDPEAIADVTRARLVLEVAGVRNWRHATHEEREGVRAALKRYSDLVQGHPSQAALNQAHLDVHRSFVALNGSQRLTAVADTLNTEIRLALASVDRIKRNAADQVHSHELLVRLLDDDDFEAAAEELIRHLQGGESSMKESVSST